MAMIEHKRMSKAEFLEWEQRQPDKWELVDGEAVLRRRTRGMAGGSVQHGLISMNIGSALKARLRGSPCAPLSSDVRVQAESGFRYPDVTVDCGPRAANALTAGNPRVLFEVLSPSNRLSDQLLLLEDYQSIASVQEIVFVSQSEPSALLWTRSAAGWARVEIKEGSIGLPSLGVSLPFEELYEGAVFETEVGS